MICLRIFLTHVALPTSLLSSHSIFCVVPVQYLNPNPQSLIPYPQFRYPTYTFFQVSLSFHRGARDSEVYRILINLNTSDQTINIKQLFFQQLAPSHGVLVGGGVIQQPPTHHLLTQNTILGKLKTQDRVIVNLINFSLKPRRKFSLKPLN